MTEDSAPVAPSACFVIFGAHGDLTKRLLIPALYDLVCSKMLADGFKVIGVDRVESNSDAWRAELSAAMQDFTKSKSAEFNAKSIDSQAWDWLSQRLSYVQADFSKDEDIKKLGAEISGNAVFYLAVAARFFAVVVAQLGKAGLLKEEAGAFRRVIIEKPYGADLASARELNARILAVADEKQIFRIDHFLGKETVQNIFALRFANGVFEPLWKREYVSYVEITAAETIGVEQRGAFYEPTGALRDMVPNHLFQLLTMMAMEPPNSFDAEDIRSEKAKLLKAIKPIQPGDVVRGQYGAGQMAGQAVVAYRDEPDVAKDSQTETYVAMQLYVENWRWAGVPFYLRTGKRMAARRTQIVLHFRKPPFALFQDTDVDHLASNALILSIEPEEGLKLSLSAKFPGPKMKLAPVDLHFSYQDSFKMAPSVGYETLIYDCLMGDSTLFQRADMIEASWAAVDAVLQHPPAVEIYPAGSAGPEKADALLGAHGQSWRGF